MPKPIRICSYEGCGRTHYAKGLCQGHHRQKQKGQKLRPLRPTSDGLTFEQRFWVKVNKSAPNGCWEWTAATNGGYGVISVGKRMARAHRLSWEFANGPIPEKMVIDHKCTNRACVNPSHLRVVTQAQNLQHLTESRKNNTSGIRGVDWRKNNNAWRARVQLDGKTYSGGLHPTLEDAARAVRVLRAQLHTHDDHHDWLQTQE